MSAKENPAMGGDAAGATPLQAGACGRILQFGVALVLTVEA